MEKETKEKTIYDLKLHESLTVKNTVGGEIEITKVPGGWVYAFSYPGFRQSPIVFIPYNNDEKGRLKVGKDVIKI